MSEKNKYEVFGIAGRVALVTGGNRNIGRSIAVTLARAGATAVILYGSDEAAAKEVHAEIGKEGGRAAVYQADLVDVSRLREVVKDIERNIGSVDILVNNAAVRPHSRISKISVEEWDRVFATNLRAPFFLSQAVLPAMVRKKWGRIISLGGTDAYWGKLHRAHNVSAKMGLVGLSRALANEVARFGITVNVLVPGTIDTVRPRPDWYPELQTGFAERKQVMPMARLGQPQEVAHACLYLASELAGYTTGQEIFASGGAFPLVRQPWDEYPAEEF
ncbi:MAG TPA: SDR family oxidoreductase [Burkholderiales bacterium]|jgi:3-oxoacyl-[acyl-carrier protein] reductase|nr:SDR family oxidoreductase [Burkholderiales bacterium]